jgi:hypothetical protein
MERTDRGGHLLHRRRNNDPVILTLSLYTTRCLSALSRMKKPRERNRGGGAAAIAGVHATACAIKRFPSLRGRKFKNLGQT